MAEVAKATTTVMTADAGIDVSARELGDGGRAVVWANDVALVHGSGNIKATGGAAGGDGGDIETAGGRYLQIGEAPDASASDGHRGRWFVDATNVWLGEWPVINTTYILSGFFISLSAFYVLRRCGSTGSGFAHRVQLGKRAQRCAFSRPGGHRNCECNQRTGSNSVT
ncbi:MAG: hypothetical protein ACI9DC_002118 [Gammaproteobacteria bacterium]|jgi:hypothetical protein